MKKNKFITSTVILIIGSILTKFINMGIRILVSRVIGSVGMGVYMLVVPIFSLFISLSQMGLPVAISKLVSEKRNNNKNIIVSATITIMIFNFFLSVFAFELLYDFLFLDKDWNWVDNTFFEWKLPRS